ncbi:MAG: hypothetical protein AAFO82_21755 [Bacteroidota bacterium]
MITITYSTKLSNTLLSEVEERLQNLALAYQKEKQENVEEQISLQDDKVYLGKQAVMDKLEDLEREMKSWWYCDC